MVYSPLQIDGARNIFIGKRSFIAKYCWLGALPLTGSDCKLEIGDGVVLGHYNHIYATKSIKIEDRVLTADKVYISDNTHDYEDITQSIVNSSIRQLKEVVIGEGSWLGENVCVIGASVGKHSVIGANSVVTKDIPDYCIAVGAPAKIVKRYCFDNKEWRKTDASGNFV
jgi:acetyltransferase-like isoleucine patch superfamily enzyme